MKIMGVLGGMGPLATADFIRKVVGLTDARRDSEHIHTIIDSHCHIPDRSSYILGHGENPLNYLIQSAKNLEMIGADYIVMPCNTAHFFYKDILNHIDIPFINMIEETAKYLKGYNKVGLLATEGTYSSKIYNQAFEKYNIEVIQPSEELKKVITDIIYSIKGGKQPGSEKNRKKIEEIFDFFKEQGTEKVVLGCTELSLIFNSCDKNYFLVDPTEILARSAIKFAGRPVKKNVSY